MIVIFCSNIYNDLENEFRKIKNAKPISGHLFQMNIIEGLIANNVDLSIVNVPRISYFPKYNKIRIKPVVHRYHNNILKKSIGFINIVGINFYTQIKGLTNEIKKLIIDPNEKYVLVTFNSGYAQSKAILKCKKEYDNLISCDIIGDLHGKYGLRNPRKGLLGIITRWIEEEQDALSKCFDCYVLLTEAMADAIPVCKKPYAVLEGIYNDELVSKSQKSEREFADRYIFYAGSICMEYGIEHLLKSFSKIKDKGLNLLIAGNGDGKELIENYAKSDNRIKYLGVIIPEEVKKIQSHAVALVSPRQSDREYVNYSFPSKTMECLASGIPYIAHRLPCEPEEYSHFICYPKNESDIALADEINRVISMSKTERDEIGERAKRFILEEKNPHVMCKRIVNLWEEYE